MKEFLSGINVMPAAITAFNEHNGIDLDSFGNLIRVFAEKGADAVFVGGGAGEGKELKADEFASLIQRAVESAGKVPVIAHVGFFDLYHANCLASYARNKGVKAIAAIVPYMNPMNRWALAKHYNALNECRLPLIVYCNGLKPKRLETLAKALPMIRNLAGVKITDSSIENVAFMIEHAPKGVPVFTGKDALFVPVLFRGSGGCISAAANVCLGKMKEIAGNFAKGNRNAVNRKSDTLIEAVESLTRHGNIVAVIKAVLCDLGIIKCSNTRVKMAPCDRLVRQELNKMLALIF